MSKKLLISLVIILIVGLLTRNPVSVLATMVGIFWAVQYSKYWARANSRRGGKKALYKKTLAQLSKRPKTNIPVGNVSF